MGPRSGLPEGWVVARVCRRPRRGETIMAGVGLCEVTRVGRHGLTVEVVDTIGRRWELERAPSGHWTVCVEC